MTPEGLVELEKVTRLARTLRTVPRILLFVQQVKKRSRESRVIEINGAVLRNAL